jgi:integrase
MWTRGRQAAGEAIAGANRQRRAALQVTEIGARPSDDLAIAGSRRVPERAPQAQLELRLKLGQGRPPADALAFTTLERNPRHPDHLSRHFSETMTAIGLPHVTLHTLRHTHASELDILTISRRLGHSSAAITLGVYGHLMSSQDAAADVVEAMLKQ